MYNKIMPITLCIDIGGSSIKMLKLDSKGKAISERSKKETPRPATPRSILKCIGGMLSEHGRFNRASVGFPGVVQHGIIKTAPNLDRGWANFNFARALEKLLQKPTRVANDSDIQRF